MRVVIMKPGLTEQQLAGLQASLSAKMPELQGWSYSYVTGELELDFGEDLDEEIQQKISGSEAAAEGTSKGVIIVEQWRPLQGAPGELRGVSVTGL